MTWILPTPLLLFAGAVALLPLATVVRWLTSVPHLLVATFAVTLGVIAAVWAGWALLWLLEQRW